MPNTKSARKRLRQNVASRQRNRSVKSNIRRQLRKVREALVEGDVEKIEAEFKLAAKTMDRAAAKNIIHPNQAGRIKSRMQRRIKAAKQG